MDDVHGGRRMERDQARDERPARRPRGLDRGSHAGSDAIFADTRRLSGRVALFLPRPTRCPDARDARSRRAAGCGRARVQPVPSRRRRSTSRPRAPELALRRDGDYGLRDRRRWPRLAPSRRSGRDRRRRAGGGRSGVPRAADGAAHQRARPQRARLPAFPGRADHRRAAERRRDGADGLRPARRRQRPATRAGATAQRRDPPGPASALRVGAGRGDRHRARTDPMPLGGAAAGARWQRTRRRDRRARPPGVRGHASGVDRSLACGAHPQDRQQGPPQPPREDRPRWLALRALLHRPLRSESVRRSVYRTREGGDQAAALSMCSSLKGGGVRMHSIRRAVTLAIVVLVVLVAADVAQLSAQGKDPRIGTWKLNVAKSKYDPGPAPQSQTLKVDAVGKGEKITSETGTADGKKVTVTYTANL